MQTSNAIHGARRSLRFFCAWPGWMLFFGGVFGVYLWSSSGVGSDDNIALRYLPLSIIRERNFDLNEFSFLYSNKVVLYPVVYQHGRFLSFAPVGPALLATPFYLIPTLAGISAESLWLPYMEKVAAAGIAALSVLFVFLTLARLVSITAALLVAGLYAFGTATFGVSSQSLWPVGSAQLLLAVALYLLTRGVFAPRWTPYAALPLSWAVLSRPSAALIGMIVAVYVLWHQRSQFLRFALWALPAISFQLVYNSIYFDNPLLPPGYVSSGGQVLARHENFNTPLIRGLTGLLISPSVGFFVYSPVFIFALVGMYRCWRLRNALAPYLAGAALAIILLDSKLNMWWGGIVMGPRYVVEVAPILAYFLAFGIPFSEAGWRKLLFSSCAAWAIYANGILVFAFDGSWDYRADLWSWSNSPILHYSQRGLAMVHSFRAALTRQIHQLPDSRSRDGLAAHMQVEDLPARIATTSLLDVAVRAKNSGDAVWLRRTPDVAGTVRFGWRWVRHNATAEVLDEGRSSLLSTDLLPGQRTRFVAQILAPPEPGLYDLELGMVSEGVAWFGHHGAPLRRVGIEVAGEPRCSFERTLATMADPTEPPLHLQWVADRTVLGAHEVFSARLNITNPGPARVLYPVIVLQWPSGVYSYLNFAQQRWQSLCPGWIDHGRPVFLDRGYRAVEYPMLTLLLADMPEGIYTLYFLYVRPKDARIRLVANTALRFERVP